MSNLENQQNKEENYCIKVIDLHKEILKNDDLSNHLTSLKLENGDVDGENNTDNFEFGNKKLSKDLVDVYQMNFESEPKNKLAQITILKNSILESSMDYDRLLKRNFVYNRKIKDEGKPVTNQRSSGRCQIFAGLNCMRISFMKKYKLSSFELSQPYIYFWHRFESANWFLESVIRSFDENIDSRLLQWLNQNVCEDGGQYDMFTSLVCKYGLVPLEVYPEVCATKSSRQLLRILSEKLRTFACHLRKLNSENADIEEIRHIKSIQLGEIYTILAISLGTPPKEFSWRNYNKDNKEIVQIENMTPLKFSYCYFSDCHPKNYVSIINDPRNPYYQLYTIDYIGNVVDSNYPIRYINLPIDDLKKYTRMTIEKHGLPVWFGCDVGKESSTKMSLMDPKLYDFELLFGPTSSTKLDKKNRLLYGHGQMTHAMVFTALDVEGDKVLKQRVENSWGSSSGENDGYFLMTDEWFSEHVYQIVIAKKLLTQKVLQVLETEPTLLPPWDPMGTLA